MLTNPSPNPNLYEIPVEVPLGGITGVKWLKMSKRVYHWRDQASGKTSKQTDKVLIVLGHGTALDDGSSYCGVTIVTVVFGIIVQ